MSLRTILITTIATLAASLTVLGTASPASAASPVVVSPANGGSVISGSTGPLVIDFPTAGNYLISVECGGFEYFWYNGGSRAYSGRQSIVIDALEGFDDDGLVGTVCEIEMTGGVPYATTTSTFTVTPPPLSLGELKVTKPDFYPLVKDGYLDETSFLFSVNRTADATLSLTSRDGKTVYSRTVWLEDGAGRYEMPWKGQTTTGKPVAPGRYRATVTVVADGVTLSQSASLRVSTKTVNRRETLRKEHWDSKDSAGGSCYTSYDDDAVILDCWGGAYARSIFNFKIPANATNIRWGARTSYTSLDRGRGRLTKNGTRTSKTTFQVRVQVTGWRAVYVHGASVTYKARVQI